MTATRSGSRRDVSNECGTLFFLCTTTLPRSSVIVQAYLVRPGCFFLLLFDFGQANHARCMHAIYYLYPVCCYISGCRGVGYPWQLLMLLLLLLLLSTIRYLFLQFDDCGRVFSTHTHTSNSMTNDELSKVKTVSSLYIHSNTNDMLAEFLEAPNQHHAEKWRDERPARIRPGS